MYSKSSHEFKQGTDLKKKKTEESKDVIDLLCQRQLPRSTPPSSSRKARESPEPSLISSQHSSTSFPRLLPLATANGSFLARHSPLAARLSPLATANDDDFRLFVDEIPEGCRLTIVSDSCHSGGLIENTKEQIGESTKRDDDDDDDESGSIFSLSSFLRKTKKNVRNALQSRGIDIPLKDHHSHGHHHHEEVEEEEEEDQETAETDHPGIKNRSLPLSTLVEILKQKTGKEDINVGNIRPTLFDMFGEDSSPKVKKFMNVILQKLGRHGSHGGGSSEAGFLGAVGGLAVEFLKHKLEENDENYAKPAMKTRVVRKEEVYAGSKQGKLPHNGILISGCQSDQTSADATPPGKGEGSYGALSNAIQAILAENVGYISNRKLVATARKVLSRQGFKQRPGLYCSDEVADEPFVC